MPSKLRNATDIQSLVKLRLKLQVKLKAMPYFYDSDEAEEFRSSSRPTLKTVEANWKIDNFYVYIHNEKEYFPKFISCETILHHTTPRVTVNETAFQISLEKMSHTSFQVTIQIIRGAPVVIFSRVEFHLFHEDHLLKVVRKYFHRKAEDSESLGIAGWESQRCATMSYRDLANTNDRSCGTDGSLLGASNCTSPIDKCTFECKNGTRASSNAESCSTDGSSFGAPNCTSPMNQCTFDCRNGTLCGRSYVNKHSFTDDCMELDQKHAIEFAVSKAELTQDVARNVCHGGSKNFDEYYHRTVECHPCFYEEPEACHVDMNLKIRCTFVCCVDYETEDIPCQDFEDHPLCRNFNSPC